MLKLHAAYRRHGRSGCPEQDGFAKQGSIGGHFTGNG